VVGALNAKALSQGSNPTSRRAGLVRPGGHARPGIWYNNIKYLYSEEMNKQNYSLMENSTYCVPEFF
jgi:hypothetical protein